jgi:hypothetical protein
MIRVTALPDTHTPHLMQAYAGLTDLADAGKLELRYFEKPDPDARAFHRGSLWAEVQGADPTRRAKVCVDFFDGGEIATQDGLEKCDVYFKRSYDPRIVSALPPSLRTKVRPLGLNCFLLGDHDRDVLRRVIIERRLRAIRGARFSRAEWSFRAQLIASAAAPQWLPDALRQRLVPTAEAFESPPDSGEAGSVFLQCRVWPPDSAPRASDIVALNESRAESVRLLRKTFGPRFVGGLVATSFARSHYGDCVSELPTDQWSYLKLIRRTRIGIVTRGIHGSIPWKTAEYLAASRCIVTEHMDHVLPEPLSEGEHLITFRNADECVAACELLLSNPSAGRRMQAANAEYYARSVRPAALTDRWVSAAASMIS